MQLRFSSRVILSFVLIESLMLGIVVWSSVRLIGQNQQALLKNHMEAQGALIASSLQPVLLRNDTTSLQQYLKRLQHDNHIRSIQVTDSDGRLLASAGDTLTAEKGAHDDANAHHDNVLQTQRQITLPDQQPGTLRIAYALENLDALSVKTRQQNFLIAALVLLAGVAISILSVQFLTRNLRKLHADTESLDYTTLPHQLQIGSNDEIADIARAFNRLMARMQSSHADLHDRNSLLVQKKQRLEALLNNINAVVIELDPGKLQFSYVSQEAEKLLQIPLQEWLKPGFLASRIHPEDRDWVINTLHSQALQHGEYTLDYRLQHANGNYLWLRNILNIEKSDDDKQIHIHGLIINIDEQKETEQRIAFLANHDSLTGLYNRQHFQEQFECQIAYAKRFQLGFALLFIDLNQFKYINDTLGHDEGDKYLVAAASALTASLRDIDIIGRLGGDEFGVILPHADANDARHIAEKLLQALAQQPQITNDATAHISACIGISLFPHHGTTPAELLAKADAAMYTIKRSGRGQVHVYQPDDQELFQMKSKVKWEDRISRALRDDQFVLHYQPILDIQSNSVSHHEVLLRMLDEGGELIYPGAFLGTAERFGLIRDVDKWVIRKAIQIQAESMHDGRPVTLAINLSGRHFGDDDFIQLVKSTLEEYHADPHALIFEVTETAAVENITIARSFAEKLRQLGCRLALDDFGIGYSSFHYLKNLPVDMIKIDGNFIRNLDQNSDDQAIVKAICDLARGMNMLTIAEFVENQKILQLLGNMGVDYAQGYHIAMPSEKFITDIATPLKQVKM